MKMNTANKLTLLRVFLIPVFLVVYYWGFAGSRYIALGIYAVACLTDLLDGYIARHYNQVSDFGKFADPLADKCLVMAALCCFVESGEFFGLSFGIALQNIMRSVDGDMAIVLPTLGDADLKMMMAAKLAKSTVPN